MSIEPIQRQSFITLVSTIALTGIGFLSTIYFAHTIGPAPLGAYFPVPRLFWNFQPDRRRGIWRGGSKEDI